VGRPRILGEGGNAPSRVLGEEGGTAAPRLLRLVHEERRDAGMPLDDTEVEAEAPREDIEGEAGAALEGEETEAGDGGGLEEEVRTETVGPIDFRSGRLGGPIVEEALGWGRGEWPGRGRGPGRLDGGSGDWVLDDGVGDWPSDLVGGRGDWPADLVGGRGDWPADLDGGRGDCVLVLGCGD